MMQVWADQLDLWREGAEMIDGHFGRRAHVSGAV